MTKLQYQVTNSRTVEHAPLAMRDLHVKRTKPLIIERQVYHVAGIGLNAFGFYGSCHARPMNDRLAL